MTCDRLQAALDQHQLHRAGPPAPAPPYNFSGLMFGDFYYFGQHHDPAWEGQQAFWFRRIYFTFDYTFTPKVTTRFRIEANSDGKLEGRSLTPYVKDAYLRWTFYGRQQMTLGIAPSLSFDVVGVCLGAAAHREDPARSLQVGLVARHGPHAHRAAGRRRHARLRRPVRHRAQ